MPICKECLHYEGLCDEKTIATASVCRFFKDRSKFVELPCKVGTDTYCILARYNFKRRESEYYIEVFPFEADMAKGMGEKFFLTKAEAKAKLAELKGGAE